MHPLQREKVSETKNPSDLLNRKGKYSLSFVLNFNKQKEKRHSLRIFLRKLCLDFLIVKIMGNANTISNVQS